MKKRQLYQWCEVQRKVVPIEEVIEVRRANISHNYIPDEMERVKHPLDGKYYSSKSRFRAVTRAHGYEEVGTAYENGYDPIKERERESERRISRGIHEALRRRVNE